MIPAGRNVSLTVVEHTFSPSRRQTGRRLSDDETGRTMMAGGKHQSPHRIYTAYAKVWCSECGLVFTLWSGVLTMV